MLGLVLRWFARWRHPAMYRAVIVNLISDDAAISGVLWETRGDWLVLRQAHMLKPKAEPIAIDGEAIIDRRNVSFIQAEP